MRNKVSLIVVAAITVVLFVTASVRCVLKSVPTMAQATGLQTIIIDPGHGGFDGGAESPDGIEEKNINLEVSLRLRDILKSFGFNVVMTRETDCSTEDSGNKIRSKKRSDIHNRLELFQEDPRAIVVSIHQNKFSQSKYWGTQVFYGVKQEETSKQLAETIQKNVVKGLQPENTREVKKGYKTIYLLQHTPNVMVMVECGFVSNPEELTRLCNPDYQTQMAFIIAASIMEFST